MMRWTANLLRPGGLHLKKRLRRRFIKPAKEQLEITCARAYRRLLGATARVCFIGITGSCGKTTTAELLAGILSCQGRIRQGVGPNTTDDIARTVLTVAPWHRFCVSEVSAHRKGAVAKSAHVLQPDIAVVTNIGGDHYGEYRSLEMTAAEKAKLVESLAPEGIAVLNADDDYVYAMRHRTRARVLTYGLGKDAQVRGDNVGCTWPGRLSLDVRSDGQRVHVQTLLLGEHWSYTVLAAMAAALAAGVPLDQAAKAIETVHPLPNRMGEHRTPDGVTFLRDDFKCSFWTVPACLDTLRKADAKRKIIVFGAISDTPKSHRDRQRAIIREARGVVNKIIFVGDCSRSALKARSRADDERIMAFPTLQECDAYLRNYLRAGDLILLKGTWTDRFDRLVLARTNGLGCWRHACGKNRLCDECRLANMPAGPRDPMPVS